MKDFLSKKTMRTLSELAAGRIEIVTGADARAVLLLVATAEQLERDIAAARKQIAGTVLEHDKLRAQVASEEQRANAAERAPPIVRLQEANERLRRACARLVLEKRAATDSHRGLPRSPPAPPAQPGETKK